MGGRESWIAIVGIGCRLPGGVRTPEELAAFLEARGDGVREVPPDRWDLDAFFDPEKGAPGKAYVKHAAFLEEDVYAFDPAPFGISAREADRLDPQQRLLLETSFECFEDAGLSLGKVRGSRTGVFVGGFMLDHQDLSVSPLNQHRINAHTSTGATMTVLSNRISYTFDLRGPSLTVDTACSSSLVATHLACRALLESECEYALAGGVNVMLSPASSIVMCKGQFLAPDGRCKAFEASADGYGRGEGAAVVLLARLDRALAAGHRIHAVIRATGVNQDGRTDGMPMPNGEAQEELARRVLEKSGASAQEIGYVEAHGTGTRIGDPTEARALASVYARGERPPLRLGSLKTNIGHLEAAAGVAGLVKATLSVKSRRVFPQRRFEVPNPDIPFEAWNLRVASQTEAWPIASGPALAAINSFGYGGTNAHAIVASWDEAPAIESVFPDASRMRSASTLYPISAFTPGALRARAAQWEARARDERTSLDDLGRSLVTRGAELPERAVVRATSRLELVEGLRAVVEGAPHPSVTTGRVAGAAKSLWVFTGMGPQWWGMGRSLYAAEPVFRDAVDEVDGHFRVLAGWSIRDAMFASEAESAMRENRIAQPANFVLQVALVSLLRDLGIEADGCLGHSVGEVAAAWATGTLDLAQATLLAFHRSQIQQKVAGRGTMLAAALSAAEAEAFLRPGEDLAIAAYNAPRSVAFAGSSEALERVAATLTERDVFHRRMSVEVAYHSHHMDPLEEDFRARLASLRPTAPDRPLYSTVLGARITGAAHDAEYWWRNAREPVRLHRALQAALADGYAHVVAIGPHPVLSAAIQEVCREAGIDGTSDHLLDRRKDEASTFFGAVARTIVRGAPIDLERHFSEGRAIEMPRYPFDRSRYWDESEASAAHRLGRPASMALAQRREEGELPRFLSDLGRPVLRYVRDHVVDDAVVFPAAGYVDAALSALAEVHGRAPVIEDLKFERPLLLRSESTPMLRVDVEGEDVRISARHDEEPWGLHARLRARPLSRFGPLARLDRFSVASRLPTFVEPAALYAGLERLGLRYGPQFRRIGSLAHAGASGEVLARIDVQGLDLDRSMVHPAVLDAAFQAFLALLPPERRTGAYVPVAIRQIRLEEPLRSAVWAHGTARFLEDGSGAVEGTLALADEEGKILVHVEGLVCRPVVRPRDALQRAMRKWAHAETYTPVEAVADGTSDHEHWAIVSSEPSFAHELAEALRSRGARARVAPSVDEALGEVLTHVALIPGGVGDSSSDFGPVRTLVDSLKLLAGRAAEVRVITFGAQQVEGGEDVRSEESALVGIARVAMTEQPSLGLRLVDLPRDGGGRAELDAAARVLSGAKNEEEIAIRGSGIHARRISRPGSVANEERRGRIRHVTLGEDGEAFELVSASPGRLESLRYRPLPERMPTGDELEIEVEAASLNFKDLMKAMGMLSDTALERTYLGTGLGMEAAGRIVRVGDDVKRFRVGDRVHVYSGGCLASRVIASERFAIPTEPGRSIEDCASYFVFMTAWYALRRAARLEAGERVLIHSAAGGVGLACVQIARLVGAEILATAGTEEKRDYLRGLGIAHVYDSRTLDFAADIRHDFGEAKVDVVVNALAGPALDASLELLAPGGRFIELGKQDIASNRALGLLPFNRAITFAAVDLDRMATEKPGYFAPLAAEVRDAFARGDLKPLPRETFAASDVEAAFRRFATGEVIGKVVVDFRGAALVAHDGLTPKTLARPDRSYLVTGGLGGFGLATAEWLVRSGARHVVLASRRGRPDAEAQEAIARMEALGARVHAMSLDVADRASVGRLLAVIDAELPKLAGIFHSATVLDDATIATLDAEGLERVLAAKARGALHLHEATQGLELDHFVVYGSVSAMVGNPGQAAYAAANAYLDGLVHHRRAQGLTGTCVRWGAIGDVGIVARDTATERHLAGLGLKALPPAQALELLGEVLREDRGVVGIIDIDWGRWVAAMPKTPWNRLREVREDGGSGEHGALAKLRAELEGLDLEAQRTVVIDRLRAAASDVLKTPAESLDPSTPLKDFGLDSLMAVELQVTIEAELGASFSTMELLAGRSLASLSDRVLDAAGIGRGSSASEDEPSSRMALEGDLSRESAPGASSADDLREHFLSRICVQPPYFALSNVRIEGDWVLAEAVPTPPTGGEVAPVACAEAGRHLAILGSCAASLRNAEPGRSYYPVRGSELLFVRDAGSDAVLERIFLRARCTEFDAELGRARAETQLVDEAGRVLSVFAVDYHVIPELQFRTLFAAHAMPTDESSGRDPYRTWRPSPSFERLRGENDRETFRVDLGEIAADDCLGHFEGIPAYPVSIMLRDATQLVGEALRAQRGAEVRFRIVGGEAHTERFLFAGERAELVATRVDEGGPGPKRQRWRCAFSSEGRHAASFEMEIALFGLP